MLTVRPKVAELVFQLYARPLHPELFQVYAARNIERCDYQARVEITGAGHVVTWRHAGLTLAEVATSAHHPLPKQRRILSHRLKGQRSDYFKYRGIVNYQVNFQLETLDPEIFWTFQEEFSHDCRREGMFHKFDSSGRMALGAISYINVETRSRSMLVQAFHTFPDDYAVVKSQSLIQLV